MGSSLKDFDLIAKELNDDVATLEDELDDETTADMLIGIRQSVEKHNWMLKQYMQ